MKKNQNTSTTVALSLFASCSAPLRRLPGVCAATDCKEVRDAPELLAETVGGVGKGKGNGLDNRTAHGRGVGAVLQPVKGTAYVGVAIMPPGARPSIIPFRRNGSGN